MTHDKKGETYTYNGKTYTIGGAVISSQSSDYPGLHGVILEIHDGYDWKIENEIPDFLCAFDLPILPHEVEAIETRAAQLYRSPKKITELGLDMIMMSPDEIDVIPECEESICSVDIFLLIEYWVQGHDSGQQQYTFFTHEDAVAHMRTLVAKFKADDENIWFSDPTFTEESSETTYSAYLDDSYIINHYELEIVKSEIPLTRTAVKKIRELMASENALNLLTDVCSCLDKAILYDIRDCISSCDTFAA